MRWLLGASAAALAVTGASAQTTSAIKAADVPAPKLAIEKGASLRMLAPGALRAGRRGRVPRQCAKFTKETGRGQVDFVGLGRHQPADRGDFEFRRRTPDIIIGFSDARTFTSTSWSN